MSCIRDRDSWKSLQAIFTIFPCSFLCREEMMLWTGPAWKYWEYWNHYTFLRQLPKVSVEHPCSFLPLLSPPQILQQTKGSHKVESSLCTEFSSDEAGTLLLTALRQPQLQTIWSAIDGGHKDIQSCKNSWKFVLKGEIQYKTDIFCGFYFIASIFCYGKLRTIFLLFAIT